MVPAGKAVVAKSAPYTGLDGNAIPRLNVGDAGAAPEMAYDQFPTKIFVVIVYRLGRPIIRYVLRMRIWGVPPTGWPLL